MSLEPELVLVDLRRAAHDRPGGLDDGVHDPASPAIISGRGEVEGLDKPETFNDLGNLLLAFAMLWAYLSFSQFLIIWAGNLSEEIPWYIRRLHGGYENDRPVPDALPLRRAVPDPAGPAAEAEHLGPLEDRRAGAGGPPGRRLLADRPLVRPRHGHAAAPRPSLLDLAVPIGIGGIWLATFLWFLKGQPLMVAHDPELLPALKQAAGGH